jgi:uncharacterized protein YbjQ (UPF0145 family)
MAVLLVNVLPLVVLLILGFTIGSYRERRHLKRLAEREAASQDIGVVNLKTVTDADQATGATLVMGQAVIATDYFKSFVATLRKLIGGELHTYERLMGRARREALLRMLDHARQLGASEVWNIRYESSNIMSGNRRNQFAVSVEVLAYGTAVFRKPQDHATV